MCLACMDIVARYTLACFKTTESKLLIVNEGDKRCLDTSNGLKIRCFLFICRRIII